jgi:type I restriction enzyme R subunit
MSLGGESSAVQHPAVKYAEQVGWSYLPRKDAEVLRGGESGLVLRDCLASQLGRLNPGRVTRARAEELVHRLTRVMPTVVGNRDAWEHLRGLKTIFIDEEKQERNVRFLDLENPDNNTFHVTEEWSYRSRPEAEAIRFDVVFLINGIPVLIIETKAATKKEGMAEALDQIRRYHEQGPEQLALSQLFGITHISRFLYGATWNTAKKNLYDWREEAAGSFEDLVKAFVDRRRMLRVLYDFIVFPTVEGELSKFVLRPHQMRAADKVVDRAKDAAKRRGLIWHTQGSGKTYTMITAGKLMASDPALENPTILILVDRTELEGQMAGHLESLGLQDAHVVATGRELEAVLRSGQRGIILSMIHKFDDLPANLCTRENVVVLIDEAHRTVGGLGHRAGSGPALGDYLFGALPNATFIGFTGTPIDQTAHGRGTFKIFGGDDRGGYLDRYSIRDSIPDGTTLPLNYGLAPNELLVNRETLETQFLKLAELEGVADVATLNQVLHRAVVLRNEMKSPDRVDGVARRVAEHFRENVEKSGYKAFLVAVDREACALYKDALDKYLPPDYSDVIISADNSDLSSLRRFHYDERREEDVRKAFRKPDGLPNILIVTDKLLTGFDAPILYCMYLDKPMRDHVLLQAVARVNRPYEDPSGRQKPAGLIIDFVGMLAKLEDALLFDSKDVSGLLVNLEEVMKRFAELIAQGKAAYLSISQGLSGDKEVEAIVEFFRDDGRREQFQSFISELENLYEIISPDAFLRPYLDDYESLMRVAAVMRTAFYPGLDVEKSFLRKTAELVRLNTTSRPVQLPSNVQTLTPEAIQEILGDPRVSDTVKVVDLTKIVHDMVARDKALQPVLILIGERAEEIAKAFHSGQMSTQEALAALKGEMAEIERAGMAQTASGLDAQAFAAFAFLTGRGMRDTAADQIAHTTGDALAACPQWRGAPQQERDLRLRLYAALVQAGEAAQAAAYVDGILGLLRMVQR